jgi:hypothetical protein
MAEMTKARVRALVIKTKVSFGLFSVSGKELTSAG